MPQRTLSRFSLRRISPRRLPTLLLACAATVGLGQMRPAHAQLDVQTVVVLDFEVLPGLDPNLGRKAADALAVELQTSTANDPVARQRVEVVPRARVLQTLNDTTALSPPYTDIIQLRLARAVGASSVYSGRVLSATVRPNQAARVTVEMSQFEVSMGDYSNGSVSSQEAISPLRTADNDLLIDEAINKATYACLLDIHRKPFPIGTIQVVTRSLAYINLGFRNGVARGQKYAVLRDVYRGRDANDRDIVERVKIGEMLITKIDVDQATGILTSGGGAGIKISDKVRKIYIPNTTRQDLKDLDRTRLDYLKPDETEAENSSEAARRVLEAEREREADVRRAERLQQERNSKKKDRNKNRNNDSNF